MSDTLLSVGLDVGTTSTQMVLSRLKVENKASSFAVPELEIAERTVVYRSPVHFTPLLDEARMDAPALRRLLEAEYQAAGITREAVDTGAVIITGESSRKENAKAVMEALSDLAGDFVVTTAGPDLESVLAAKGSGAVDDSQKTGKTVLHMDIGGGTSNLCLIREGRIQRTGCLNAGGRLVKFDEMGIITYVSPAVRTITGLRRGDKAEIGKLESLAGMLVEALEMAAGLCPPGPLLGQMTTAETGCAWEPPGERPVISFSGGVADCIAQELPWNRYGDLGPILGKRIRASKLCQGEYVLGRETIRATVIGAGCHSTQLSGSTVYYQNIRFPLKNLPVVRAMTEDGMDRSITGQGEPTVMALPGKKGPTYQETVQLAQNLIARTEGMRIICLEQDMAKALGQAMALRLPKDTPLLCIDRVKLEEGSYLDVGEPIGEALPVVVKTLVFQNRRK